jgi:hypothetical protein
MCNLRTTRVAILATVLLATSAMVGCGGTSGQGNATGGTSGQGGVLGTGGVAVGGTSGGVVAGGTSGRGGVPGSGGVAVGGTSGRGGVPGSGGVVAGGTSGRGGVPGSGGVVAGGTSGRGGVPGSGGVVAGGGVVGTGGRLGTGGASQPSSQDAAVSADAGTSACNRTDLVWKTASKTEYTSFPDPGSPECIQYSGCDYMGMFAACSKTATEAWVSEHNIVAAFPDFNTLKLHDLCLKSGNKTIVVTVIDTCGDSDCGGCCTQNKGTADELIDIESYTAARFGVPDGRIQWADLGPTQGQACP